MNLCLLRFASRFVPSEKQADWFAEWQAELWHVQRSQTDFRSFCFTLGALKDALWLQQNDSFPLLSAWMGSPWWCISLLAVLAVVSASVVQPLSILAKLPSRIWWAHICLPFVAIALLPVTVPLYRSHCSPALLRWMFLAMKTILLAIIIFCVALGAGLVQAHGALVGYILAFRWSLVDQRKRCPECFRLLTNPTRIGGASNTFLEWYGTELICRNGHGMMHIAEIQNSAYHPQNWLHLDPSWSSLFRSK